MSLRVSHLIAALALTALGQNVYSQTATSISTGMGSVTPACAAVKRDDLRPTGFSWVGEPVANSLELSPEQSGAPSAMKVTVCVFYADRQNSRRTFNLTVESFASVAGVPEWLEKQNSKVAADASLSRFDSVTCESGQYDATGKGDAISGKLVQHYVSCDHLIGSKRIGIGFESPDSADSLPSPRKLADLLKLLTPRFSAD